MWCARFFSKAIRIYLPSAAVISMFTLEGGLAAWAQANTAFGTNALSSNTTGSLNAAFGVNALGSNTTGSKNSASGINALPDNTTGTNNTADGFQALFSNVAGSANTAIGGGTLFSNTIGTSNTATGVDALGDNTTGLNNTASGVNALGYNTAGNYNTAAGVGALNDNTTGSENTASGVNALAWNTTGIDNTASGVNALAYNTWGADNTASGLDVLFENATGSDNTAFGSDALFQNTTGDNNIAIGVGAGELLTTGNNNIEIGNLGSSGEANTIRLGTSGTQTATFIAGISGVTVTGGAAVMVNSSGQLGTLSSSARYKRDIHDMADASTKLMKLRPVTFRYKTDPTGTQQYGLVAEEVEKVYPELVIRGADGKPETVAYHLLPAMLLNELQKQNRAIQTQTVRLVQLAHLLTQKDAQIATLQRQIEEAQKTNATFDARMAVRMDALERQAQASSSERLATAMR